LQKKFDFLSLSGYLIFIGGFLSLLQSIVLGVIQGMTEFLPISSSAHLALFEQLFKIQPKLQITILLHFASIIAVIVAMREELKKIFTQPKLVYLLIIGSLPAGVIGVLLKSKVELSLEKPNFIAIFLILTGIILWITRKIEEKRTNIRVLDALLIGIAQAIAIFPGISRSGVTIATGIYLGIKREESAKFSFLLAIISILGATLFTTRNLKSLSSIHFFPLLLGFIVSFIVSYLAIKGLLKIVKTKNFSFFGIYCWALGIIILLVV
jgi:undecaprenyl-diphosphatase